MCWWRGTHIPLTFVAYNYVINHHLPKSTQKRNRRFSRSSSKHSPDGTHQGRRFLWRSISLSCCVFFLQFFSELSSFREIITCILQQKTCHDKCTEKRIILKKNRDFPELRNLSKIFLQCIEFYSTFLWCVEYIIFYFIFYIILRYLLL